MSSIQDVTGLVKSAIESLDGELSSSPDPKLSSIPRVQKEIFKKKLEKMLSYLVLGTLPEKSQRNLGLARTIADSWPFDSKLSEEIAKAERAYVDVR